jgi:Mrp family chromosome partitioning ATPase
VVVEYEVPGSGGAILRVVPAGKPPPNPTALVTSEQMRAVLSALEARADLVVVDTAAALAVSDAMPLIQTASGVVMIVRMNRSSRAAVRRLQRVVLSSRAPVLGVVATGTTMTAAGYSDYYASYGDRRRTRFGFQRPGRLKPSSSNGHGAANGKIAAVADEGAPSRSMHDRPSR